MRAPLTLLLLLGSTALPARAQARPAPDLGFGHAFGYEIGATVEAAQAHARSRGERLTCEDITDIPEITGQSFCHPESWATRSAPPPPDSIMLLLSLLTLPPLPAYRLFARHDSIDFLSITLGYAPELTRPRVTELFDHLGARAFEGRSRSGGSVYTVWVDPGGRDYAALECRPMDHSELCTVRLGRMPTAGAMQKMMTMWRRLAPHPVSGDPPT